MSDASIPSGSHAENHLRKDLRCESVPGRRPARVLVIDEWSGQFFRVREAVWNRLIGTGPSPTPTDIALARSCGWTRQRKTIRGSNWHWSKWLAYQVPLGSADWLARRAPWISTGLFSPAMMIAWVITILVTLAIILGRIESLIEQTATLPAFLLGSGKWIALVTLFLTKVAHEWGHAVMCARIGAKPKTFGVMLFFGMPCPYCDVTDSYRSPSRSSRIAVMSAGIYVECVIATLAAWIWMGTTDPVVRSTAINVMLMCGVSTVVFNGNPLARYDGYFILSDLVGSVHLRADAKARFLRCAATSWRTWNRNDVVAAVFYLGSQAYRYVLLGSLALAMYAIACSANAQRPFLAAAGIIVAAVFMVSLQRRIDRSSSGSTHQAEPNGIRGKLGGWTFRGIAILVVLFVPLPDNIRCDGIVELSGASEVFVPFDATVESVDRVWGQSVQAGQRLVQLRSSDLEHSRIQMAASLTIDKTRSALVRQASIRSDAAASEWASIDASRRSGETQLASIDRRLEKSALLAPIAGRVVSPRDNGQNRQAEALADSALVPQAVDVQSVVRAGQPWCRVAQSNQLVAELRLPQDYRNRLQVGSPISLSIDGWESTAGDDTILNSVIESVSLVSSSNQSGLSDAIDRDLLVTCRLVTRSDPAGDAGERSSAEKADILPAAPWWTMLGTPCRGSIKQPWRSLAQRAFEALGG